MCAPRNHPLWHGSGVALKKCLVRWEPVCVRVAGRGRIGVMDAGAEYDLIDSLFFGLRGTFLEGQLILGGSSGLFAFPTNAPALADAQQAFLSIQGDPTFNDHGAERYSSFLNELESGYQTLVEIVKGSLDG